VVIGEGTHTAFRRRTPENYWLSVLQTWDHGLPTRHQGRAKPINLDPVHRHSSASAILLESVVSIVTHRIW
jgi:hypothetical protein